MNDSSCTAGYISIARRRSVSVALALAVALSLGPAHAQTNVYMTPNTWISCGKLKQLVATSTTGQKVLGPWASFCSTRKDNTLLPIPTPELKNMSAVAGREASASPQAAQDFNKFNSDLRVEDFTNVEQLAKGLLTVENEPLLPMPASTTDVDRATRVDAFFNLMYPALKSQRGVSDQFTKRVLAQYQKRDPRAVHQAGKVILTCMDIVGLIGRFEVQSALALEPLFRSCYEARYSTIEILPTDLRAQLTAAGVSDDHVSRIIQLANINLREAIAVGARQVHADNELARKQAQAAKDAMVAENNAARQREVAAERERARQKSAAAEAAEATRWAALTPAQRTAENRAAELANQQAMVAQCSLWRKMFDMALSQSDGVRAEHIATRMRLQCR